MDVHSGKNAPGQPPIFLVGCGRSGSTLLWLMLNRHSQIYLAKESYFIPNLRSRWQPKMNHAAIDEFVDRLQSFPKPPEQTVIDYLGWDVKELRAMLYGMCNDSYSDVIRAIYSYGMRAEGKIWWGDKTPRYVMNLDLLNDLFPGVRLIHLVRDGRDVALSYARCAWGPSSVRETALYWMTRVGVAYRFRKKHPDMPVCEVRYEDLVRDPRTVLRTICEFIGVHYEAGMLEYHSTAESHFSQDEKLVNHQLVKQPPRTDRIERWREEMSRADYMQFDAIAGKLLHHYGYPVETPGLADWPQRIAARGWQLKNIVKPDRKYVQWSRK